MGLATSKLAARLGPRAAPMLVLRSAMFPVISILSLLWAGLAGPPAGEPAYVGSAAGRKCHAGQHRQWTQSLHSRMIQKSGQTPVLRDLSPDQPVVPGHSPL